MFANVPQISDSAESHGTLIFQLTTKLYNIVPNYPNLV